MAKKPKSPNKESASNSAPSSDSATDSSSIFKTLFGNISEQGTSVSLFSDDNPFRRKPTSDSSQTPQNGQPHQQRKLGLGFDSAEASEGSTIDGDSAELKKRKRKKEKNLIGAESDLIVEDSKIRLEVKKTKRFEPGSVNPSVQIESREGEKVKILSFSSELEGKGRENGKDFSFESKEMSNNEKEGNFNLGGIKGQKKDKDKGRNKRRSDEIEAEYEARLYGAPTVEEGGEKRLGNEVVGEKRKKRENPEDMMVSKEGFDDEAKLLRTVFVGNLPLKVKKKFLLKEFGQFGEVESVRIRSVPIAAETKLPRKSAIIKNQINDSADSVHAYIVFKSEESAQASLADNMAVIGGNHMRVDRACPPRKKLKGDSAPLYDNRRTVFVGNLPFDVKDEEIYQLFSCINNLESSIEAVRVIRDPNSSLGKGIAYVLFKTKDAMNLVLKKRNLKLRDRELRLSHAKSNATPSKRKLVRGETENSPAKKLAVHSRTPDSNRIKTNYQGMRASKSGNQKKFHSKTSGPEERKSKSRKGLKPKERNGKRPAVAARKAALKGGVSKQAGSKQKMGRGTPDSARGNKKPRRSS